MKNLAFKVVYLFNKRKFYISLYLLKIKFIRFNVKDHSIFSVFNSDIIAKKSLGINIKE